jgi:chloride channel 3/4/5
MISVMVAKWVADAMYVEGIYDLLIELKNLPYLEAKREYVHTSTILNITEYLSTIDVGESITVGKLKHKLAVISALGYADDGGFPILSDGDTLAGYIATSELVHGLEQLENAVKSTLNEREINAIPCYFRPFIQNNTIDSNIPPFVEGLLANPTEHQQEEAPETNQPLNDFSQYIDHVSF